MEFLHFAVIEELPSARAFCPAFSRHAFWRPFVGVALVILHAVGRRFHCRRAFVAHRYPFYYEFLYFLRHIGMLQGTAFGTASLLVHDAFRQQFHE